ncbi:hypothetical protein KAU33_10635 [Candidatus Dependentiae bacterium]|nr:hypothetical protein [Candidatus Dependentiae bacterium]
MKKKKSKKKKKKNLYSGFIIIFTLSLLLLFANIPVFADEVPTGNDDVMEVAVWIPPPPPETPEDIDDTEESDVITEEDPEYYEEEEEEGVEVEEEVEEYEEEKRIFPPYPPYPPPRPPRPPKPRVYRAPKRTYHRKDPNTAAMYSLFLPGLGQFYCEEPGKGMMFLISEGIFIGLAAYNWSMADYYDRKGDLYYYFYDEFTGDYMSDEMAYHYSDVHHNRYQNWLYVGIAIHILDVIDARNSAKEYNRRHKLSYQIINDKDKIGLNLIYNF